MIKGWFKSIANGQTLAMLIIMAIITGIVWYGKVHDNDNESFNYAMWILAIVGLLFIIFSVVSYVKSQKQARQNEDRVQGED